MLRPTAMRRPLTTLQTSPRPRPHHLSKTKVSHTFPILIILLQSLTILHLLYPQKPIQPSETPSCQITHWTYLGHNCFHRPTPIKDRTAHNASIWTHITSENLLYTVQNDFPCPTTICRRTWPAELNQTVNVVTRALQAHFANATPWNIQQIYTHTNYLRENRFWGLEYRLNGHLTLTTASNTTIKHQPAAVTVRRGFTGKYCTVSVHTDIPSTNKPVYLVVPYTGRVQMLRLLYENVQQLLQARVALRLIIAAHGGPVHVLGAIELLRDMRLGFSEGNLTDGHVVQVVAARGDRTGRFSRARALMDGGNVVPSDGLMFYCDVDMVVRKGFFDNCRYNAERGYQVYYPVVYSLYPYGTTVSKEHGYWRKGAFGMVCGYKSDFERIKAWRHAQGRLSGWGFEDVLLYREFSNHWQISVFHAAEPNLLHRWHPKYCEFNAHVAACLGTVFQNMGSQQFLANIVAAQGVDVRKIPYEPVPVLFEGYKNDSAGSKEQVLEMPAAESETDLTKLVEFKKIYEDAIAGQKGGLLSVFAREAQETLLQANSQQADQARLAREKKESSIRSYQRNGPAPPFIPNSLRSGIVAAI